MNCFWMNLGRVRAVLEEWHDVSGQGQDIVTQFGNVALESTCAVSEGHSVVCYARNSEFMKVLAVM